MTDKITSEDQALGSFRRAIRGARTRLLNVRTDRDFQEVARANGWTRRVQVISQADVTVACEFAIPLAEMPGGLWLDLAGQDQTPLVELNSVAKPADGIDVLAACMEDADLMPHLVFPELDLCGVRRAPGWADLQRQWSYRGRLRADRSGLRCHLLIDLKAS